MVSIIYYSISMLTGAILGYAIVYLLARSLRLNIQELNHFLVISCLTILVCASYKITKITLGLAPTYEEAITKIDVDMLKVIIDYTIIYFTAGLLWELYVSKR